MKTLILSLILVLSLSCNKSSKDEIIPFTPQTITPVLIGKGNLMGSEGIPEQNTVITNNTSWNTIINLIDPFRIDHLFTSTTINFNEYIVIAVFDAPYNIPGHSINITTIVENSNNIVVTVQRTYSIIPLSITSQSFHIVKIPISPKPIVFQQI